eukprot:GHVU01232695.1.p1 GENE.GHVU01232695.1~~GHVU01232695.1.p1  ORF type:complete len:548 (+),score=68.73 GHVU01232695.1:308-1951(+)
MDMVDDVGSLPAGQLERLQPPPPEPANSEEAPLMLAMSPEDRSLYSDAILREYVALLQHDVIGEEVPESPRAMRMGWRLTMKPGVGDKPSFPKARWYCKGFMDRTPAATYAGTPDAETQRIFLVYLLSRQWEPRFMDAATAFLQAPILGDACPIILLDASMPSLPAESPFPDIDAAEWSLLLTKAAKLRPGQYRKLERALYGDRRSPLFWAIKLRTELQGLGYEEVAESLFARFIHRVPDSLVICHVDDLSLGGERPDSDIAAIKKAIKVKPDIQTLREGESVDFLESKLTRTPEGIEMSNDHYLDSFPGERPTRVVKTSDLTAPVDGEVDVELSAKFRSINGRLGWAVRTRPDQCVYFSLLSKHSHAPTQRHLRALTDVTLALKSTKCPLLFSGVKSAPVLSCYSDAAFKLNDLKSRGGYKIYLGDNESERGKGINLISWGTKEISQLHDSSSSGELYALKMVVKHVWAAKALIAKLWGVEPKIDLLIDNQPVCDQVESGRCKQEPSMQQHLDYVIQEMNTLGAKLEWIPRAQQKADPMTKPIWFA